MTKHRTAIFSGIVTVAVMVVVFAGLDPLNGWIGSEQPEIDTAVSEMFEKLARSANELAGAEVETDVFFDGATVEGGRVLTYAYTVAGVPNRPFDAGIVRMATEQLNRKSCADRIVRNAIDGGGAVRYIYLSSSGSRVLVIEVDRQSCLASE